MVPEFFKIGSFSVSGYLCFFALGIGLGSLCILYLAGREGLDPLEVVNFLVFAIISLLLGSKLYGVFYNFLSRPAYYHKNPVELLQHFFSGGVFYGGLIGIVIFSWFYLRRFFKGREWAILDLTVLGGALGHVFGRIGCFMGGCCYGRPTRLPWGVRFPYLAGKTHPWSHTPVHPTQLYEAILNLLNFILLYAIYRKKKFPGQIMSLYLIHYGIIRWFVEYFRNDGGRGYLVQGPVSFLSLSFPQVISLVLILAGILLYRQNHSICFRASSVSVTGR